MPGPSRAARLGAVAVAVLLGALAAGSSLAAGSNRAVPARHVALSSFERGILADINTFRRAHHLAPLQVSVELVSAARQHSREMAADGYFAHSSANGTAFWRRIQGFYGSRNWSLWSVGENLLWSAPGVTASSALAMWKRSPEHRKNLLTARWRGIGISAVHVPAAPGVFHGLGVTIITTDFGVRR